jgi:DNA-binding IclR family transcriptional regulator
MAIRKSSPSAPLALKSEPRDKALVKSAGRVLEIFEYFDEVQKSAKVGEISEHLTIPQSSTSVLLRCLTELGYLDYDGSTRLYTPNSRIALMGVWADGGAIRDGRIMRLVEDVSRSSGCTVGLATRNRIYSQYVYVAHPQPEAHLHIRNGSRVFLIVSASGHALLSAETDDEAKLVCRLTRANKTFNVAIKETELLKSIRETRDQGYAVSRGRVTPGAAGIAMLLPVEVTGDKHRLVATVSGSDQDLKGREEQLAELLKDRIARHFS